MSEVSLVVRLRTTLARVPAGIWFTLVFVLFCCAYEYGYILHLRPLPHHIMRQTDCLGLAWNYAFTDPDFFTPRMMSLNGDLETVGHTAGEFPLLYWIVGMLWRVTGQSEFIYRLIGLLIHFAGSYALFRIGTRILRSAFWSGWIALLFFTSPAVVYFAISFLPDVPALDLVLIGWACFARYVEEQRPRDLMVAFACMSLAMLLKITAGMSLVALVGVLFLESALPTRAVQRWQVFQHRALAWCSFLGAMTLVFAWYGYAAWFNRVHGNPFTPNSVWPIWEIAADRIAFTWHSAGTLLVYELFAVPVWLFFVAMILGVLWVLRRLPWQVAIFNASLLIGALLFCVLWFQAFNNHDYYFINPMVVLMSVTLTFLWWAKGSMPVLLRSSTLRVCAVALLSYSLAFAIAGTRMRARYSANADTVLFAWTHPAVEIAHWQDDMHWSNGGLMDIEPYLDSIGVTRANRVIVVPDPTWQASLYLMGRVGWNDYTGQLVDSARVAFYVRERNADHLLVLDDEWRQRPFMRSFLQYPVGAHEGVTIYDLRPLR